MPRQRRKLIQNLTDQAVADLERMLDDLTIRFAKDLDMEDLTDGQFYDLIMDIEKKYHFHGA